MDDLLKRLRSGCETIYVIELNGVLHDQRCIDAAEEIERLRVMQQLPGKPAAGNTDLDKTPGAQKFFERFFRCLTL